MEWQIPSTSTRSFFFSSPLVSTAAAASAFVAFFFFVSPKLCSCSLVYSGLSAEWQCRRREPRGWLLSSPGPCCGDVGEDCRATVPRPHWVQLPGQVGRPSHGRLPGPRCTASEAAVATTSAVQSGSAVPIQLKKPRQPCHYGRRPARRASWPSGGEEDAARGSA